MSHRLTHRQIAIRQRFRRQWLLGRMRRRSRFWHSVIIFSCLAYALTCTLLVLSRGTYSSSDTVAFSVTLSLDVLLMWWSLNSVDRLRRRNSGTPLATADPTRSFTVFVMGVGSQTIPVVSSPDSTVLGILSVLRARHLIPDPQAHPPLVYAQGGHSGLLDLNNTLAQAGLGDMSTLHVRYPLLGGARPADPFPGPSRRSSGTRVDRDARRKAKRESSPVPSPFIDVDGSSTAQSAAVPATAPPLEKAFDAEKKVDRLRVTDLWDELARKSSVLSFQENLVFVDNPGTAGEFDPSRVPEGAKLHTGPYALDTRKTVNHPFLEYEAWLFMTRTKVESELGVDQEIIPRLHGEMRRLKLLREAAWTQQRARFQNTELKGEASSHLNSVNTSRHFASLSQTMHPAILACHLAVLITNLFYGLARDGGQIVLASMRTILRTTEAKEQGTGWPLTRLLPRDTRTILNKYDLDPQTRSYLCCPKCYSLYDERPLPFTCSHQDTPDSPICSTVLWRTRTINEKGHAVPLRKYIHQDMVEWVGRLLSRPGIEEVMDVAHLTSGHHTGVQTDIWDAPAIRNIVFKGAPFITPPSATPSTQLQSSIEGRYVFALSVDGFNPFTNKEAKQTVTCTAIYMVCLNLPPHLRFLRENLFLVGVVPGPNKPSLHHINHVLKPLVDDLLKFWDEGIFFSRTAKYSDGRLVRCALGPLVCDLPAARQVAGFGAVSSTHFCSCCWQELRDMDNFQADSWKPRDASLHRKYAEQWRDATTEHDRAVLFKSYGIRWSELLRLPYWDPIVFTVIDTMHNHYLGLLATHCRDIWGMSVKVQDGDGISIGERNIAPPHEDKLAAGCKLLCNNGTADQLRGCNISVLWAMCQIVGVNVQSDKKKTLVDTLILWRSKQTSDTVSAVFARYYQDRATSKSTFEDEELRVLKVKANATLYREGVTVDTLKRHRKDVLQALCTDHKLSTEGMKEVLSTRLLEWLHRKRNGAPQGDTFPTTAAPIPEDVDPLQPSVCPPLVPDPENPENAMKKGYVLGRATLSQVHIDMTHTVVPSWISPAPSNLGTPSRGKLSADQWRSACAINLPTTLIRLWGGSAGRHKALLDNFLDLVTAVETAGALITTPEHVTVYKTSLFSYLTRVKELYPRFKFKPNHHISMHVGEVMKRFGPLRSVRAFATERNNHMLQLMNTNMKFGEMEITYLMQTCREANVRALIRDDHICHSVSELVEAVEHSLNLDGRGTRAREAIFNQNPGDYRLLKGSEARLDAQSRIALCHLLNREAGFNQFGEDGLSDKIVRHTGIQMQGLTYRPSHQRSRDSHVYVKLHHKLSLQAAFILDVVSHTRRVPGGPPATEAFIFVKTFNPLTSEDAQRDHYRSYPRLGARLFYKTYSMTVHALRPKAIACHFSRTDFRAGEFGIDSACLLALSLDRISHMISSTKENDAQDLVDGMEDIS